MFTYGGINPLSSVRHSCRNNDESRKYDFIYFSNYFLKIYSKFFMCISVYVCLTNVQLNKLVKKKNRYE